MLTPYNKNTQLRHIFRRDVFSRTAGHQSRFGTKLELRQLVIKDKLLGLFARTWGVVELGCELRTAKPPIVGPLLEFGQRLLT